MAGSSDIGYAILPDQAQDRVAMLDCRRYRPPRDDPAENQATRKPAAITVPPGRAETDHDPGGQCETHQTDQLR